MRARPNGRKRAREVFAELVADEGVELRLDEAAAWIGAEEDPEADPRQVLRVLDNLAIRVRMPDSPNPVEAVARLHHALFTDFGLMGSDDEYDDPTSSFLHRVLDRRSGLPILLCIAYLGVARRVGLPAAGVAFPARFLVRPASVEPAFWVDPYEGGKILRLSDLQDRLARLQGVLPAQVPEITVRAAAADVGARAILVRVNRNLKRIWREHEDWEGMLRAVDRMLVLDPLLAEEHRDRGLLLARLGHPEEAARALTEYLARAPDARDVGRVALQLSVVQRTGKLPE